MWVLGPGIDGGTQSCWGAFTEAGEELGFEIAEFNGFTLRAGEDFVEVFDGFGRVFVAGAAPAFDDGIDDAAEVIDEGFLTGEVGWVWVSAAG